MPKVFNKLNWQLFSNQDRITAIEALKAIISKNDGYIVNFNLFSDLALSLTVEIEEQNISNLYSELETITSISESKPGNIDDYSKKDWWILMNVSFSKGKGNLKVEIPDVPG